MKLTDALELFAARPLEGREVFQGLQISIENKKGSVRSGVDSDGKPWSVKMTYPYGYIRKSEGVDGDHVDCFLGPNKEAKNVYVIHTVDPKTGKYDEDKCLLGFDSPADAKKAFLENYSSPKFFGSMDVLSFAKFKQKVLATKEHPAKITAKGLHPALIGEVRSRDGLTSMRFYGPGMFAGGSGSGCNPAAGKCGRKSSGRALSHNALLKLHDQVKNERGEPEDDLLPREQFVLKLYSYQRQPLARLQDELEKLMATARIGGERRSYALIYFQKGKEALVKAENAARQGFYSDAVRYQESALTNFHSTIMGEV